MSGDENTNSNQLQDNPATPMSIQDTEELKSRLAKSQSEMHQLKIENEKNSQLFAMFDQKMKEVQNVIEQNSMQKKLYVQALKKYLIELEEKNRRS